MDRGLPCRTSVKRRVYDGIAKQIGKAVLELAGAVESQVEIDREAQYADLRFTPDPGRTAELARSGLLGRLAGAPCIFELYSKAVSAREFRGCVAKHLASWHRTEKTRGRDEAEPSLWRGALTRLTCICC